MAAGFKSAGRVYRDTAANGCMAFSRQPPAFPKVTKAQRLNLKKLGEGCRVMDLGDIHILRRQTGLFIGRICGEMRNLLIELVGLAVRA